MGGSTATWDIDISSPRPSMAQQQGQLQQQGRTRETPVPLTGAQVLEQFESFEQVKFGKTTASKKRKRNEDKKWHNGRKKSNFFELPYWTSLLIRHNLDIMHIEKNIYDSILVTLLELEGKCKDREKARLDMEHLRIRPDQHHVINNDEYTLPPVAEPPELSRLKCAGHHHEGNTDSNALQMEQFLVCRVMSRYNHRFSDRISIPRTMASPEILQP